MEIFTIFREGLQKMFMRVTVKLTKKMDVDVEFNVHKVNCDEVTYVLGSSVYSREALFYESIIVDCLQWHCDYNPSVNMDHIELHVPSNFNFKDGQILHEENPRIIVVKIK